MTEELKKDNVYESSDFSLCSGFNWAKTFDGRAPGQLKIASLSPINYNYIELLLF